LTLGESGARDGAAISGEAVHHIRGLGGAGLVLVDAA
jgi:hypothetical protein